MGFGRQLLNGVLQTATGFANGGYAGALTGALASVGTMVNSKYGGNSTAGKVMQGIQTAANTGVNMYNNYRQGGYQSMAQGVINQYQPQIQQMYNQNINPYVQKYSPYVSKIRSQADLAKSLLGKIPQDRLNSIPGYGRYSNKLNGAYAKYQGYMNRGPLADARQFAQGLNFMTEGQAKRMYPVRTQHNPTMGHADKPLMNMTRWGVPGSAEWKRHNQSTGGHNPTMLSPTPLFKFGLNYSGHNPTYQHPSDHNIWGPSW